MLWLENLCWFLRTCTCDHLSYETTYVKYQVQFSEQSTEHLQNIILLSIKFWHFGFALLGGYFVFLGWVVSQDVVARRFNCSATRIKTYWSYGKPVHYLFIMPNKRTKDSGSGNILPFGRILPKNAKLTCRPLSRLEWYVARTVKTCKICIWSSLVSRRNEWTNLW